MKCEAVSEADNVDCRLSILLQEDFQSPFSALSHLAVLTAKARVVLGYPTALLLVRKETNEKGRTVSVVLKKTTRKK